ncbi:MAG: AraC family transcriptional regulator [Clostridia bacterium]
MDRIVKLDFDGFSYHHSFDDIPNIEQFHFHCHGMLEIYFFQNGVGEFVVEGNRYTLHRNSFIILRQNEFHYFKLNSSSPYERCALHFNPTELNPNIFNDKLLSPFFDRNIGERNQFIATPDDQVEAIFQRIDSCTTLPQDEKEWKTKFLLGELLVTILNLSRRNEFQQSYNTSNSLAKNLLHYINLNITSKFSLDELAALFFVNKFYLSHVFKKFTGVSVLEYSLRKKVLLASQLIKNGRKASEASELCGFGDYSTFYRAYKRILGLSPSNKNNFPEKNGSNL